jgi:hypothetical protein
MGSTHEILFFLFPFFFFLSFGVSFQIVVVLNCFLLSTVFDCFFHTRNRMLANYRLRDFDWSVRAVLSSSAVEKPSVQTGSVCRLAMDVQKRDGAENRAVVELRKAHLERLLSELDLALK